MNSESAVKLTIIGIITAVILVVIIMAGYPFYKVWSQEMRGKAALAEAYSVEDDTD